MENEAFNVMKNHGYELEHNFGHGKKFLAMILAGLNLLAFAWHTLLEIRDPPWRAARQAAAKANQLLRRSPHPDNLCRLSRLAGLVPVPRHLHHSTRTAHKSKNRIATAKKAAFRIAATSVHGW